MKRTAGSARRTGTRTTKVSVFLLRAARCALSAFLVLVFACKSREKPQFSGDANHGKELVAKYGCASCHVIPNVEPKGMVGPPLQHVASRQIIGGKLPNSPENMMAWLQNPQLADPNNSMPNLGVTPADARDLTAFLETLK
ncbi:MAG TPA: cytochrome c [Thermoanaerobaculia bacterium]